MKTVVVQNQFLEGVADLLEDGQAVPTITADNGKEFIKLYQYEDI